jgi:hypothetical protein
MVRIREVNAVDADALVHLGTKLIGMLQQHQVELAAVHMVGVVLANARLLTLRESDINVAIGRDAAEVHVINLGVRSSSPRSAELVGKLRFFHLRQEVEIFEHAGRRWYQRLSYVLPRHQFPLKNNAVHAGFRQICGHARTCRAASKNTYFKVGHGRIHSCCFLPRICRLKDFISSCGLFGSPVRF